MSVISLLLLLFRCSRPGDIVLDPFGGCGTTALTAGFMMRQGISIDLSFKDGDTDTNPKALYDVMCNSHDADLSDSLLLNDNCIAGKVFDDAITDLNNEMFIQRALRERLQPRSYPGEHRSTAEEDCASDITAVDLQLFAAQEFGLMYLRQLHQTFPFSDGFMMNGEFAAAVDSKKHKNSKGDQDSTEGLVEGEPEDDPDHPDEFLLPEVDEANNKDKTNSNNPQPIHTPVYNPNNIPSVMTVFREMQKFINERCVYRGTFVQICNDATSTASAPTGRTKKRTSKKSSCEPKPVSDSIKPTASKETSNPQIETRRPLPDPIPSQAPSALNQLLTSSSPAVDSIVAPPQPPAPIGNVLLPLQLPQTATVLPTNNAEVVTSSVQIENNPTLSQPSEEPRHLVVPSSSPDVGQRDKGRAVLSYLCL